MNQVKLSICIPTNGITEWVLPVLDSIYKQKVNENDFEVVITDNGSNDDFKSQILNYQKKVGNMKYEKTDCAGFTNQIRAFELAEGKFIKFLNHRMLMNERSVRYLLDFIDQNIKKKPYVYFSNGELKFEGIHKKKSFDDFAYEMGHWLSWSAGIGLWKSDFDQIHLDKNYSDLFPHLNLIFPYSNKDEYIIDNTSLTTELKFNNKKKGRYNLFNTFGVEFIRCISDIYDENRISTKTYDHIKDDTEQFLIELYYLYVIRRKPCSYDISNMKENLNVYYNYHDIRNQALKKLAKNTSDKLLKFFRS
jgi:hypothetical protein